MLSMSYIISHSNSTLKGYWCTQLPGTGWPSLMPFSCSVVPQRQFCAAGPEEWAPLTCQCLPSSVYYNLHVNQKEVNCEIFNLIFLEEWIVICLSFTECGWWHSVPTEKIYLFPTPLFIGESFFQDLWELFRLMSKRVSPHRIWTRQAGENI